MKQTSILAHESIKPQKEILHTKILVGLKKIEKGTFREIAKASNLDEQQVWKRLSEMERKNMITYTDEKKQCEVSHRLCGIWKINERI